MRMPPHLELVSLADQREALPHMSQETVGAEMLQQPSGRQCLVAQAEPVRSAATHSYQVSMLLDRAAQLADGFVVSPSNAGASASVAGSGPPIPSDPHEVPIDDPLLQPLPQAISTSRHDNSTVPTTALQRQWFDPGNQMHERFSQTAWLENRIRQGIRFLSASCQRHPLCLNYTVS